MSSVRKKIRIGDLLVQNQILTEPQLQQSLDRQRQTGMRLGRVLVELGFVEENKFLAFLAQQLDIAFVDLKQFNFDASLVQRLQEIHARRYRAIVLSEHKGVLTVGMADPMDIFAYDELSRILQQDVEVALVRESELLNMLDLVYRRTEEIASYAEALEEEITEGQFDLAQMTPTDRDGDAPVVKLLKSIFEDAVQIRASDIHIEPDETVLRIRLRVDGVLQEQVMKEKRISSALVLRLKLMAGLNISEKRLPQDGRISLRIANRPVDVRVSTMPSGHGERVVLRLLDKQAGRLALEHIGMDPGTTATLDGLIHRPHGIFLVTGPTGSGKTTTLYAGLSRLNEGSRNIMTVEDPIEYFIEGIAQTQVNTKVDMSFARGLRAILRQDPDVVMVGEIRDLETAQIAIQASLTGHLVFSTLHTNTAIGAVTRLRDMGAEPFLLASSLVGVLAQRLVRVLCPACRVPARLEVAAAARMGAVGMADASVFSAAGCPQCNRTGYRGRTALYELVVFDAELRQMVHDGASEATLERHARKTSQGIMDNGLQKVLSGVTSPEELLRVMQSL